MSTLSNFMDQDIARGEIVRVLGMVTRDGVSWAKVQYADGSVWFYPEQNYALNIGLVASQEVWS